MMKRKHILYLLLVLPLLCSCNNEDDIEEIFTSGTWYLVDYFGKANWNKQDGVPTYNAMAHNEDRNIAAEGIKALEVIQKFSLTFKSDGTFTGGMQHGSFEGTWQADGKERTVFLTLKGNPNTSTNYNREFINTLKQVVCYQGDSKVLLLAPEDKKSYIQLRHVKQD